MGNGQSARSVLSPLLSACRLSLDGSLCDPRRTTSVGTARLTRSRTRCGVHRSSPRRGTVTPIIPTAATNALSSCRPLVSRRGRQANVQPARPTRAHQPCSEPSYVVRAPTYNDGMNSLTLQQPAARACYAMRRYSLQAPSGRTAALLSAAHFSYSAQCYLVPALAQTLVSLSLARCCTRHGKAVE